ncbi:MAG: hypothetical protein JNL67_23000 [Planctomycetaceae bacterium]|nr:hypothetical protein [Planctomycetaceae bacterium]
MGHSEMLLAVAGLNSEAIKERTKMLATGDFSSLPPKEGLAHQWAYRLTKEADQLTALDRHELIQAFGDHRALDLVWYISWCNYMTRVADAFQLPLEEENVFEETTPAPSGTTPAPTGTTPAK